MMIILNVNFPQKLWSSSSSSSSSSNVKCHMSNVKCEIAFWPTLVNNKNNATKHVLCPQPKIALFSKNYKINVFVWKTVTLRVWQKMIRFFLFLLILQLLPLTTCPSRKGTLSVAISKAVQQISTYIIYL